MNKKGFTLIELMVSIALISIVMIFLFQLLNDLSYNANYPKYARTNQVNRAEIIKNIQAELLDNPIVRKPELHVESDNAYIIFDFASGELSRSRLTVKSDLISFDDKFSFKMDSGNEGASYDYNHIKIEMFPETDSQKCQNSKNALGTNIKKCMKYVYYIIKIPVSTYEEATNIDDIEIFLIEQSPDSINEENDNIYNFNYIGEMEQVFTAPRNGRYLLEAWGAEGGVANYINNTSGGYGAYSTGIINLNAGTNLYINVGGIGKNPSEKGVLDGGGYNGGGDAYCRVDSFGCEVAGGGGASSIALTSGTLNSVSSGNLLLVAAGGGGAGTTKDANKNNPTKGGSGGGVQGLNGTTSQSGNSIGYGATQSAGGNGLNIGSYGLGGSPTVSNNVNSSGGGGGYYGGGSSSGIYAGAGGGSSYLNSSLTSETNYLKHMTCYKCSTNNSDNTRTISTTYFSNSPTSDVSKTGNGYVRITYIG